MPAIVEEQLKLDVTTLATSRHLNLHWAPVNHLLSKPGSPERICHRNLHVNYALFATAFIVVPIRLKNCPILYLGIFTPGKAL
jgi:hypothetical protein